MKTPPESSPSDWTTDSPEFTAFALKDGPFDPSVPGWAERRAEAEQVVARSAALRSEIGEIRRVADDVETDLAREPVHRLSTDRRESVLAYARNPGRGLPRRSTDDSPSVGSGGWHRFWSAVTRPAMGFSLAAATALSIALALWSPWSRQSPGAAGEPVADQRPKAANAAKPPRNALASDASTPVEPGPGSGTAEAVAASAPPDAAGPVDQGGDTARVGSVDPVGDRPDAAADAPRAATGAASGLPEGSPRGDVVRGEAQLRWQRPGAAPLSAKGLVAGNSASPSTASASRSAESVASSPPEAERAPSRAEAVSRPVPGSPGSVSRPGASARSTPMSETPPVAAKMVPPGRPPGSTDPLPRREARTTRELPFQSAAVQPRSTFPLKPGDASYPEVRRSLEAGRLPDPDSVRFDELLNHFTYEHPIPAGTEPLSAKVEVADSPWNQDHRLVKIGLQARPSDPASRPPANLVVLVGLRPGSEARLAWAQRSLHALVESLDVRDSLALLLDGPRGRIVLPPTAGRERNVLSRAVATLRAEGAPQGLEGLRRAYALASQRRIPGAVNRVVWILDGEFTAEAGTRGALTDLIREQTEWGVLLTVLGLGADGPPSPRDRPWMPTPAGGTYAPAAGPAETRELLRRELQPPSSPAAEDVTVDVRFNPDRVDRWRLLGQETIEPAGREVSRGVGDERGGVRLDPGEAVTALYEIVPTRPAASGPSAAVAPSPNTLPATALPPNTPPDGRVRPDELLSLEVGYRPPDGGAGGDPRGGAPEASRAAGLGRAPEAPARSLRVGVPDAPRTVDAATADYKFAAAVVGYGLLLRDSPHKGDLTWDKVVTLAEEGQGPDREGYRQEFLQLVRRARALQGGGPKVPSGAGEGPSAADPAVRPRP